MRSARTVWVRLALKDYDAYRWALERLTGYRIRPLYPLPRTGYIEVAMRDISFSTQQWLEREHKRRVAAGHPRATRGQILVDSCCRMAIIVDEAGEEWRRCFLAYLLAPADSTSEEMNALLEAVWKARWHDDGSMPPL
ncbi:MAG: hypothetical protein C5B60_00080 [Chloroflexi bacterium]|nr:MAG: hypothetical protein C5B60_00080 [Chloroflexota bacterium]